MAENIPAGMTEDFLEYAKHMPYLQGRAFEALYLAHDEAAVAEAAVMVRLAFDDAKFINASIREGFPRIDPNLSHKVQALYYLAHGRLDVVLKALDHFGVRILELREPKMMRS